MASWATACCWPVVALDIVALLRTVTTGASTALAVTCVLLAVASGRLRNPLAWPPVIVLVVLVIGGSVFAPRYREQYSRWTRTARPTASCRGRSSTAMTSGRTSTCRSSSDRWLAGFGPDIPPDARWKYTESVYVTMLLRGGILLLGIYLAFMVRLAIEGRRLMRDGPPLDVGIGSAAVAIVLVLAVTQIIATYFTTSGAPQVVWVLAALVVAAGVGRREHSGDPARHRGVDAQPAAAGAGRGARRGRLYAVLPAAHAPRARPAALRDQRALTTGFLVRRRPRAVLVQNPPIVPGAIAYIYCRLTGARLVLDSHPRGFGLKGSLAGRLFRPLHERFMRHAAATMVASEPLADEVRRAGGRPLVVHEPPPLWRIDAPPAPDAPDERPVGRHLRHRRAGRRGRRGRPADARRRASCSRAIQTAARRRCARRRRRT